MVSQGLSPPAGDARPNARPEREPAFCCPVCAKRFHLLGGVHAHARVKHIYELVLGYELLSDLVDRIDNWPDPAASEAYMRTKNLLSDGASSRPLAEGDAVPRNEVERRDKPITTPDATDGET